MPNYRTHSIHGENVLPQMNAKVKINIEALKSYCMGPDAMIATSYETFKNQHEHQTRDFFVTLLKMIKEKKLYENEEVMAYLYGQIDHFTLDTITHPLIYYMTEGVPKKYVWDQHGLVENWIDNYVISKFGTNDEIYYHHLSIKEKELAKMIDELYEQIYFVKDISKKYSLGLFLTNTLDVLGRRNKALIWPLVAKIGKLGPVAYSKDYECVLPYLNLENNVWLNPETGEELTDSFNDLWYKSQEVSLETIDDVNRYIYQDKSLTNPLILNDISYNTGLPCEKGQSFQYIKK